MGEACCEGEGSGQREGSNVMDSGTGFDLNDHKHDHSFCCHGQMIVIIITVVIIVVLSF